MDQAPRKPVNWYLVAAAVVILACACAVFLAGAGYMLFKFAGDTYITLTESPTPPSPPVLNRTPASSVPTDTATLLGQTTVPDRDLYALACRLKNVCGVSTTLPAPSVPLQVGDRQKFWVQNTDTAAHFQVAATLRYITTHSYFWVADGIDVSDADIDPLMNTFENKIYPTDREFFGSEWTPGVDGDPHIYLLYVHGIGQSTAGYFSAQDEYNPLVSPYSNGHEMFIFSADGQSLTDADT